MGIDAQLDDIRRLDQGKARKQVMVLGAGMAGLCAAYELTRLGHAVSVVEATGRAGGRVMTKRFSDGQYNELGAMRIPASHDYTKHYVNEMKLELRPFITAHAQKNAFYFIRGRKSRIREAADKLLPLYRISTLEKQIASALVAPAIMGLHFENVLNSLNDHDRDALFGARSLTDRVAKLEAQTLGEFLTKRLESDDARELIGVTTGLEVWWDKALSMFLRDEIMATGDGLSEIVGGMDKLPSALANVISARNISFNTEVVAIERTDKGVAVRTRATNAAAWDSPSLKDASIETHHVEHVVCAIPFGVLRSMHLSGMDSLKMRSVRNLNYAASTKVLLHCKKRIWESGSPEERIIGGASLSDAVTRATYYPSDHAAQHPTSYAASAGRAGFRGLNTIFSKDIVVGTDERCEEPGPGVLVGSYNWGRDARRLGCLSLGDRAETVLNVLDRMHPGIKDVVDDEGSMAWDTFRWSRGAFCFMAPGDLQSYYHDAIRPQGNIHFAGEHCSLDQAWIQGAVMSALRVVQELVSQ